MIYADTDLFVALLKTGDWLKSAAETLARKHKGELWTSEMTIIELLLIADEIKIDPERLVVDAYQIAKVSGMDLKTAVLAAHYVRDEKAGVFDALHAACCGKDNTILSSDKIFDRLGLQRIKLEAA